MSYGGYYKTGYSSSRGRGYVSRGSYRSRGGAESSYYGRGSYRGRSNWQSGPSSGYESRSHYTSGTSSRADDSGYHRYSRGDEGDYSSHDRSYHDTSRKRMRTDHGYVQASSSHRSHEGGYGAEPDYSNRYYSGDKESYGYHDERRMSSGYRDRSRDDYAPLRKQEPLQVGMTSSSSRYMPSRGSYRSRPRGMSIRGYRGAISKISYTWRPTSVFARRRTLVDPTSAIRKRIVSSRTQADILRKIRMAKLRRIRELTLKREALKRKLAREEASKGTEDVSDEDDEENEKEDENEEDDEIKAAKKKAKLKKQVKKKTEDGDEEKEAGDDDEEDEEDVEDEEDEDDKEKAGKTGVVKKKHSSKEAAHIPPRFQGRQFIKLNCPHCYQRCITFQEYNAHLYSFKHLNAVRKLWTLHKAMLTQLRVKQRKRQRIIDSQKEGEEVQTQYCLVCKLNYGEKEAEHQASEYHKKIMDFMRPYCRICKYKLSTPMMYEKHLCSLEHIKRKALLKSEKEKRAKAVENGSEAEGEDKDLDLDKFMTLDSVGTFDDAGEGNKKEEEDMDTEEKKSKAEVLPGSDHIKEVNVQYCGLCRMYLTRSDKSDKAVVLHCQSRTHLASYMRYHRRVERLEAEERRKMLLAKKAAKAVKKEEDDDNENEKMDVDSSKAIENDCEDGEKKSSASQDKTSDAAGDAHELDDEKMWADVDKDLGDILREVEPDNKSSDEDDEGGRYDRFKYSKKGKEKATEDGEDKGDNKEEAEVKSATPSPAKKATPAPAAAK